MGKNGFNQGNVAKGNAPFARGGEHVCLPGPERHGRTFVEGQIRYAESKSDAAGKPDILDERLKIQSSKKKRKDLI